MDNDISVDDIPVTLPQHFVRQAPRYGVGLLLIGSYQASQYWFDTRLSQAINEVLGGQQAHAMHLGLMLIAVAVGALVIRIWSRIAVFNGGRLVEYELRRVLLHHLMKLGPSFYQRMTTGDIMSRVTNDLVQVRLLLGFGVLTAMNTVLAFISALAVTLQISAKLTLGALATMPILFFVMRGFGRSMFRRQQANQEAIGVLSSVAQSSIAGIRVVRSFALEAEELRRFEQGNQLYLDAGLGLARLRSLMFPIMQAITACGMMVVLLYGGWLMLDKELTAGGFLAFYRALSRLTWPLISLGFLVSLVQRGRASYARLQEVFAAQPDIVDGPASLPAHVQGRLEVKDLGFHYGDHAVLEGVSFVVEPGQSLAIVGRTGSGKSTLAALLARLLPTPVGSVSLDGIDVCDLPLDAVRKTIGYTQQSAFLFSTTVARNIAYALRDPDSHEALQTVRAAAAEAQILAEIESLPEGFDTVVGERGVQLSGGQKQRIALARALVSSPNILILDDPLSAVDARTEKAILETIEREKKLRSIVLITHRVAAASRCDQVIVLEAGKVVARGQHEQLLREPGPYAAFAEEQRIERELEALSQQDDDSQPGAVSA